MRINCRCSEKALRSSGCPPAFSAFFPHPPRIPIYFTAIVTVFDCAPPTEITTGIALPEATPAGIVMFTCITPFTSPGAGPAYCTAAGSPPIVAVTVSVCAPAPGAGAPSIAPP